MMPSLETFTEAFKGIENMKSQCEGLCKTKLSVSKKEEIMKTFKVQTKEQEKTIQTLKHQLFNNDKQFQKQIQTMREINNGMNYELKQRTANNTEEERNRMEETMGLKNISNELDVQQKKLKGLSATVSDKSQQKLREIQNQANTRMSEVQTLKQKRVNRN